MMNSNLSFFYFMDHALGAIFILWTFAFKDRLCTCITRGRMKVFKG